MADLKISELNALAGSNLVAADELAIVDDSASETKKITVSDLITNGVTVISDDSIPGAKILFAAGDIPTASLANSAVTTEKLNDSAVTAAKLGNESTVDLLTTLPSAGAFTGQLAFDTDDNKLYLYDGSSWQNLKAAGSVNTVAGSTTGEINIVSTVSGDTATLSATIDNTTSAAQFLAGPTGSGGVVGYRTVVGSDLPTATTSAKGGVVVNGNGLIMDGDTIEINNAVTSSGTHHVVTYDANGLITGGRTLVSSDLPIATASARGAVIPGDGVTVDVSGNLSVNNTVAADTYTKVTVTAQGLVSAGTTLLASDIPDHSAAKLTSGTIPTSILANSAVTGVKLADQATTKFGGALGSDNVTIFPSGDYKGQFFYDETTADLYIYTGSAYVPITLLTGNLVNAGVYNANTNLLSTVTTAGSSAGFTAGAALPAPTGTNLNHYVVVSVSGTGTGAAPAVALAPPDMLLSQGVGAEYSLIDVSNAIAGQTAANISVVAAGNIIATNVQSALQELDTEKLQLAGGTMTGDLNLGTGVDVVFEGSAADDYETTLAVTNPTADRTITLPNVTGTVVTTGDTGTVTSTMLLDGTIVNADINASAEIAVSKLANGTARQLLQTDAGGSGVEFTSNVDVPGTLDVTGAVTLDSTLATTGLISANGKISFPLGTAAAPSIYFGSDTNTGVFSPAGDQVAITTAGTQRVIVDSSGNVGIGTSSPGTLFDLLGTNARLRLRPAADTQVTDIAFGNAAGSSTRGLIRYDHNTENMFFETNASERLRIDSSGNVGIGTTTPSALLQVGAGNTSSANARAVFNTANSSTSAIRISNWTGSATTLGPRIQIDNSGHGEWYMGGGHGTNTFVIGHSSDRLTIDSSGNVGIGVTSPARYPLHVHRNSTSDATIHLTNDSTGSTNLDGLSIFSGTSTSGIWSRENIDFRIATNNTERMRIDSSGNVGIGTTSPDVALMVHADSGVKIHAKSASTTAVLELAGTRSLNAVPVAVSRIKSIPENPAGNSDDTSLTFETRSQASGITERMRISSAGRIEIGAAAGVNTADLHVMTASNNQIARFEATNTSYTNEVMRLSAVRNTSNGTYKFLTCTRTNIVDTLFILDSGNVQNVNNSYGAISDSKLKENIVNAGSQWNDLKALSVRKYNFKEETGNSTHTQIGLIAQEVEVVSPGLVSELPDHDEEGNDLGTVTKSVNYSVLYVKAVKALQEAMARIETLEASNTDLLARVTALEAS